MFINLSNHPSEKWDTKQKEAAALYGEVVDLPFPQIPADADEQYVDELSTTYCDFVLEHDHPVVMVQGEFTFTYLVIKKLKEHGIAVITSCSERQTKEWVDETGRQIKQNVFEFVRFRRY